MGKRNYLIEGVSGTGKTSVCTELPEGLTNLILQWQAALGRSSLHPTNARIR